MNASDYQTQAARTLIDGPGFEIPDRQMMLVWCALGLVGEAGEIAEHIKKGVLHRHGLNPIDLEKEIGDCAWYLAALCTKLDLDLSMVMAKNIDKLNRRYPNGFTSADSVARRDVTQHKGELFADWDNQL